MTGRRQRSSIFTTIIMWSVCMASWRRRGSTMVTAFTIASSTRARDVAAATFQPRTSSSTANPSGNLIRQPFALTPRLSSQLRQSSTSVEKVDTSSSDLAKVLEITHPAYEVIERDVVTEYGAYCTLFRHKKSGAELLSVSSEDDNKVFGKLTT